MRTVPEYTTPTTCDECLEVIPVGSQAIKERTSGGIGDNWGWFCSTKCVDARNDKAAHRGDYLSKKDREGAYTQEQKYSDKLQFRRL